MMAMLAQFRFANNERLGHARGALRMSKHTAAYDAAATPSHPSISHVFWPFVYNNDAA
jgi:hypothetical protein